MSKNELKSIVVNNPDTLIVEDSMGRLFGWARGDVPSVWTLPGTDRRIKRISGCVNTESVTKLYVFWVADCFDPSVYLVGTDECNGDQDAFAWFITECEDQVRVNDVDLPDYDEDSLNFNDNGTPVDTESVNYVRVRIVQCSE